MIVNFAVYNGPSAFSYRLFSSNKSCSWAGEVEFSRKRSFSWKFHLIRGPFGILPRSTDIAEIISKGTSISSGEQMIARTQQHVPKEVAKLVLLKTNGIFRFWIYTLTAKLFIVRNHNRNETYWLMVRLKWDLKKLIFRRIKQILKFGKKLARFQVPK